MNLHLSKGGVDEEMIKPDTASKEEGAVEPEPETDIFQPTQPHFSKVWKNKKHFLLFIEASLETKYPLLQVK